jgi:hypothetical protein
MKATSASLRRWLRIRPLAAALAFAGTAGTSAAQTFGTPDETNSPILREDGTPLRVALRAWHEQALRNPSAPNMVQTTRPVTNCADDGPGSLRGVIAASGSGDTVDLTALTCSAITLQTGAIAIRVDSLTLAGPGAGQLAIDGNDSDRLFLHYGAGSFIVRDLTVRNGSRRATGFDLGIAGCIASAGYTTLDRSVVTGCVASGEGAYGGAIYAYSLILSSSTLSNNVAYGTHPTAGMAAFGGAAFVYQIDLVDSTVTGNSATHFLASPRTSYDIGGGVATIRGGLVINSTIDSNYAYGRGGGLASFASILIRNSTISGNTAQTYGGGGVFLRFPGNLDMRNSTVTANHGRDGGGMLITPVTASVQSSIVAGNTSDVRYVPDLSTQRAVTVTGADNLIDEVSANIVVPGDSVRGNPGLLPLAYNGGPTRTHALRTGSPAIDSGNNTAQLSADQRGAGYPRVVGPAPDIGAFEFNPSGAAQERLPVPSASLWSLTSLMALLLFLGILASRKRRTD